MKRLTSLLVRLGSLAAGVFFLSVVVAETFSGSCQAIFV
jgi:hypothetical protein